MKKIKEKGQGGRDTEREGGWKSDMAKEKKRESDRERERERTNSYTCM